MEPPIEHHVSEPTPACPEHCYSDDSVMLGEWSKLRSWNGSQEKAFEELCCQVAAAEQMPEGCKFTRKGTPDAGVECFWTLPNGNEWGWQAKFFSHMQATQ